MTDKADDKTTDGKTVDGKELDGVTVGDGKQDDGKSTLVEVKVGDKTMKVEPAVAEALKAAQAAAEGVDAKVQAAVEAAIAKATKPADDGKQKQGTDWETLIFTDPKKAVETLKEEIRSEYRSDVATTNAQREFWTSFYKENPELEPSDLLVKAVLTREYDSMKAMTVPKARAHLAEATQKELLKLGVQPKKDKQKNPAEGGTEPSHRGSKPGSGSGDSPQPGGLSAAIKARREARKAALSGAEA